MVEVFAASSIGTLHLKNRILRAATHEGMATADGAPAEDLLKTYRKLSIGGAGAIITGYVSVKQNGRTFPNMRMFDSDVYIDRYKAINDQLERYATPVILQIALGGSRAMSKITGQDVLSASPRRKNDHGDRVKEASDVEIRSIIEAFVAAIARAKEAGFSGVELHAAHGYLLSEFISPAVLARCGPRRRG